MLKNKKAVVSLAIVSSLFILGVLLYMQTAHKAEKTDGAFSVRIEAEDYMSQSGWGGNVTQMCMDIDGGENVGFSGPGKSLKYKVDIPQAGKYLVRLRVANGYTNKVTNAIGLKDNSGNVLFSSDVPSTGDYQDWKTLHGMAEFQKPGEQTITVFFNTKHVNLNWIEISTEAAAPELAPTSPVPGLYSAEQQVSLVSPTTGTKIYYTIDGTKPTEKSPVYTSPIIVDKSMTIKAISGVSENSQPDVFENSAIAFFDYKIGPVPKLGKDSIETVVNAMSIYEKASLLGGDTEDTGLPGATGGTQKELLEKFNIPSISLIDGTAGAGIKGKLPNYTDENGKRHTLYSTQFPNETMRAATWNPEIVRKSGEAVAKEVSFLGADGLLSPGMNIVRNPLNGRNFEYYSEDPYLTGKMAAAEVEGIQSQNVAATIKHFAANNQETGRGNLPTNIGQRALREIYLRGFEMAVKEAQPWALMSSYNQLNGVSTAQNPELLQDILRKEWGFTGLTMSDWGGAGDSSYWKDSPNAYASLVKAGLDLAMPRGFAPSIIGAYQSGFLSMEDIDANVKSLLQFIMKTSSYKGKTLMKGNNIYADENEAFAFDLAVEGMSILKNMRVGGKAALPIKSGGIAVLGNASTHMVLGGKGSGGMKEDETVLVELPEALKDTYKNGLVKDASTMEFAQVDSEMSPTMGQMNKLVADVDSVVVTIARSSGEGEDIPADKGGYYLTDAEQQLIDKASMACRKAGKPLIIVLNIGTPIEVESWKDKADAILLAWEPGSVLAKPVAAVLTGAANPSGKLPVTFPIDVKGQNPENHRPYIPATNFGSKDGVTYSEGIYIGYRYYDTFDVPASYEFGYGKNYSSFVYSNLQLSADTFDKTLDIAVDIKNTSEIPGKETVQLYVGAPGKSMQKPVKELKGFAKTSLLSGGQTDKLHFTLEARSLASFDAKRSGWVVEPGAYTVYAAASSKDIRQTAEFNVPKEIVVEHVHDVLAPKVAIDELEQ